MTKHIPIHAEVQVNAFDMMGISKEEIEEHVKHDLINKLAEVIVNNDLGTLTKTLDPDNDCMKFRLSLAVVNLEDYNELRNAINRNNFQIVKDGEIIPLIDLL
jgi:Holliday junction resolvasome RuvABC DNA-binding subunit